MKKIALFIASLVMTGNLLAQTFIEQNGTLSSSVVGQDVEFARSLDVTIAETGTYLVMASAMGSSGGAITCYHGNGLLKVWNRTKNIEILRVPFNHIFGDNTGSGNVGMKSLSFPYYVIEIVQLSKGDIIGMKGSAVKQGSCAQIVGNWQIYDARLKIAKL